MIWWHKVGQKVVCVDDKDFKGTDKTTYIKEGEIYIISSIVKFSSNYYNDQKDVLCFHLEGIDRGYCYVEKCVIPFKASRFRPVKETSIECFKSMLNPTPEQIKEYKEELEDV